VNRSNNALRREMSTILPSDTDRSGFERVLVLPWNVRRAVGALARRRS
jgi:hypothetical protein